MNKFWKWMKENYSDIMFYIIDSLSEKDIEKMLIGYMVEYLLTLNLSLKDMFPQVFLQLKSAEIKGVYNWLESKINFINNEE